MDAARLLQILPVEAATDRSSYSTQTTSTSTITTKLSQIYMLNIENENNQLRNNTNQFQVQQTTAKSPQLISSMLQATTNSTSTLNSNFTLPLISNFSTIDLLIVTVLITLILVSIIGNCLVCVAIFTDRRLRKLGNAFIVSLAIADLFVSCLVMTFALCNDFMNYWIFGDWFCDVWISFDIMCCTASILNLCAISLDRFIHIKDCLFYNQWMTKKVAISAVIIIWFISALVSFVPINLGWHKPDYRFGGGSVASSPSSVLSVMSSQANNNHYQQHVRYKRRVPNQQTTFDASFQLQHSMSIPSGTLITSSFDQKQVANNSLLERGGASTQEGAKLNYLSKHVQFTNIRLANNRKRTTTAAIEPIENQSSPYPTTTPETTTKTIEQSPDSSYFNSQQNLSARFNRDGFSSQIINRRRQRDSISSYGSSSSSNNHHQETWHKKSRLEASMKPKEEEIDSSGSTTTTNKSRPPHEHRHRHQQQPQPLSTRPQSNKVESNPLDRSQIELDPPKAWLLELEREVARKATSSSTSRRQVNPASAALKLSRLPELTGEDETSASATANENATSTSTLTANSGQDNDDVDLIAARQQLIIQYRDRDRDSATADSMSKSSLLVESINNNNDNNNTPQLPLCILTLTPTYAVISSTISFYIPCIIMLGLYTKLFACARKHVKNIQAISKAPAPISVRPADTATTTTSATSTSSPGDGSNKGNKNRCVGQQGRHRRLPKIAMLECGSLSNPIPMRTWLKFGRKQQQQQQQKQQREFGEKVNEKYSNAQLYDKSRSKSTIFSLKNGAKGLVVSNEVSSGNELVELARFTASDKANIKQQQQLSETPREPDNDLGLSEVRDNDPRQRSPSSSSWSSSLQKHQKLHCNAVEIDCEVAKRTQMAQFGLERQAPGGKNGKNISRKSLIGNSENEKIATLTLGEEEVTNAVAHEEQLPFLAGSQEINNRTTRSPKQMRFVPANESGNCSTTETINFSNQINFQQQQQQQQQQQSGQQLATHKAAITLGIIMGTFLFCWVPFFCLNITKAFCVDCIPSSVFRFFTWLGYANSALNPIIYGIHNSEFRNAFNRIFFKHLNIKNSRYYLNRRFSYDLRQQSVHQQKIGFHRKDRNNLQNNYGSKKGFESKQSFKSCRVEALA